MSKGPPRCPKCGYQRGFADSHVHPDICPKCGISYSKFLARQAASEQVRSGLAPASADASSQMTSSAEGDGAPSVSFRHELLQFLLAPPRQNSPPIWWGRAFLWVILVVWGLRFWVAGMDWEVIGASFLHGANLAFHEFGHLFFSPFGHFMMVLGGSLFQVLVPLGACAVFVFQQRDNFAASVALWWCGQSFMDLAPYIADAKLRALPLVGGGGEESHDWGNLLTWMGCVEYANGVARLCFLLGCAIMLLAWWWGATLLRKSKPH
ncbi:Hypothetical protein HDN1F_24200 [gamma proteobacterium HdN1]|nr:Hypothetical protein HDN1F_24200 [gamma proteobacterium HdN1]